MHQNGGCGTYTTGSTSSGLAGSTTQADRLVLEVAQWPLASP